MTITTRWWWIRHAPVTGHGGRIYGQDDLDCDCSDGETFGRLAAVLPQEALWVTSHLRRARDTAAAIAHRLEAPPSATPIIEPDFAEQSFGHWQGLTRAEIEATRRGGNHRFWLLPAGETPPGGESFEDVMARVVTAVERLGTRHAGRDIVAVAHGGTIRAALGLALGLDAQRALAFTIDNCALTLVEHHADDAARPAPAGGNWRVCHVNLRP
jgi:broad specificity phosphatase PhoE